MNNNPSDKTTIAMPRKLRNIKIAVIILVILSLIQGFVAWYLWEQKNSQVPQNNIPTSADNAPPESIHNLPVPDAVSAVRTRVAADLGISEGLVIVMSAYEKEWPNACLGLASSDEMCAQVITPGFEVTVQAQGKEFVYRTNSRGTILRENIK